MNLRDRLLRVSIGSDSQPHRDDARRDAAGPPLEALVEGQWLAFSGARCFVSEHSYSLDHVHGGEPLGDLLSVPPHEWQHLVSGSQELPFAAERALFIDTETTGLARGAGTVAFMVGVGLYHGDAFVVRQYFMPDYADEMALLDLLADDLIASHGLVTFNGRSFDWPIISTRYTLSQREIPRTDEPHLDLLLVARRLWRRILDSCALSALETDVLGLRRTHDDVPGYLIPQLYQDYLQFGHAKPMARVFYHNEIDILSMVSLATRMGRLLTDSETRCDDDCCDLVALGQLYERLDRRAEAIETYTLALEQLAGEDRALAQKCLSLLYKRMERFDEAMVLWQAALDGDDVFAHVELAKQYEHRLRDYPAAREVVLAAIAKVDAGVTAEDQAAADRQLEELHYRLDRLERRIARM